MNSSDRKLNQEHLLYLASLYKGLNRKELGAALGRDPTKLFPPTGNPKLDYLVKLSELLDWPVGDVAMSIWNAERPASDTEAGDTFESLNDAAREAHRKGEYARMVRIASKMASLATTSDERALAAHRESGGWDGLGRYVNQLDAVRRGLRENPTNLELRLLLQVNLANAYFTLWYLFEARAMAKDLIEALDVSPPTTRASRAAQAFAHFVYGNSCLRLGTEEPEGGTPWIKTSLDALETSRRLYAALADEFDSNPWRGIANTCAGAILEAQVELRMMDPMQAVSQLADGLETVTDTTDPVFGDRLESYGWWCIFGCGIALRHLTGSELQRHMAIFTNKGYEIADSLNNWAMRERLFTMEFLQRQRLNDLAGFRVDWTIDNEEVKLIVGTMGRFPTFRNTGWQILQSATVVGSH
ncbi:MAG: hypothetical protein AB7G11_10800 [Phycisphaerales bacterium]